VQPLDPDESDWQVNGAGHNVSHHYGFGLFDVGRAVYAAKHWVPWSDARALASGELHVDRALHAGDAAYQQTFQVDEAHFAGAAELIVEHVEVNMTVSTDFRSVTCLVVWFGCAYY
jgi:hypothetical protein